MVALSGISILERRRFLIDGAVQGVGFRPFIYNLACRLHLTGHVANTSQGVAIEAQGDSKALDDFHRAIVAEAPPLAQPRLAALETCDLLDGETSFDIRLSHNGPARQLVITPDAATCDDCLAELADPADRRYRYPFINCTQCGPRYTIIFDVPYDRPNTTMHSFTMCPQCQAEYDDPANRRFHAQPNACALCGPHLWLIDPQGSTLTVDDPLAEAVRLLQAGSIVAVKGLGGFHLAVRADNDQAVLTLRERKYRKAKAFALMFRDLDTARPFADISPAAAALLTSPARPIVLCPKRRTTLLSTHVAGDSRFWGVLLPYTPLHHLLMQGDFPALVMTSGNNSDEPIETDNDSAVSRLGPLADALLLHDRAIYTSCDDSVAKVVQGRPALLRRARGYVPQPVKVARRWVGDILALGAEMKNTITLLKDDKAFVSQHIGDLRTVPTYEAFLRTIDKLTALIGARPAALACDLHPALLSSRYAQRYHDVPLIQVQHHHAHIAAVMGEHNLQGPVVGLTADGIGYGADGSVWGGELLTVWPDRFERVGFVEPVPMPGSDAASREPWRMALSYLLAALGPETGLARAAECFHDVPEDDLAAVARMAIHRLNSPVTSSIGRLFDGVSALLGLCRVNTYDAQAAIELENLADPTETTCYPVTFAEHDGARVLQIAPLMAAVVADLDAGVSSAPIAGRFHNTIVAALADWACWLADRLSCRDVALAGGVFQNDLILTRLVETLQKRNLNVYFNRRLTVNDGAISFGQALVADALLQQQNCPAPSPAETAAPNR